MLAGTSWYCFWGRQGYPRGPAATAAKIAGASIWASPFQPRQPTSAPRSSQSCELIRLRIWEGGEVSRVPSTEVQHRNPPATLPMCCCSLPFAVLLHTAAACTSYEHTTHTISLLSAVAIGWPKQEGKAWHWGTSEPPARDLRSKYLSSTRPAASPPSFVHCYTLSSAPARAGSKGRWDASYMNCHNLGLQHSQTMPAGLPYPNLPRGPRYKPSLHASSVPFR